MPHLIVDIDELVRPIIDYLVEISPRTAVSFALTCRSLEEPALSSLWKQQRSFIVLVKVLPQLTWIQEGGHLAIERDPPPEDWDRLQRYASWMRKLVLSNGYKDIFDDTLSCISHNSPDGVLCPRLEQLDCDVSDSHALLRFFHLFLSPQLKSINFNVRRSHLGAPDGLSFLAEVISCLPTSLEHLFFTCDQGGGPLTDAVSSLVRRCGSSLKSFGSNICLSEAAIHHLVQLPNLCYWFTVHGPPRAVPPSIFPSLERLHLDKPAALPWLHLLAAHREGEYRSDLTPTTTVLRTNVKEKLKNIICPDDTPVDPTLLSSISQFRDLVTLEVQNYYCVRICTFGLTDDDVENLAIALPSLVDLRLGAVCVFNSCRTTVSSLLSISIHCLGLASLEIHFNTQTIVGDMQRLLDEGSGRDKPRCGLRDLSVGRLPLQVREEDVGIVAMGFANLFPCLESFGTISVVWDGLASQLRVD